MSSELPGDVNGPANPEQQTSVSVGAKFEGRKEREEGGNGEEKRE